VKKLTLCEERSKWSNDAKEYIAASLSPSKVVRVEVNEDEKSANVTVPDFQLSLAIGKEGQNARLAAKLTGWKIDIKSESQLRNEIEKQLLNYEGEVQKPGEEETYTESDLFNTEVEPEYNARKEVGGKNIMDKLFLDVNSTENSDEEDDESDEDLNNESEEDK
jgi:N utilization substance protein A